MSRGLPHSVEFQIAIDPTTAPIKATPSAEPASTASEKPRQIQELMPNKSITIN
jgi:hypothetical protein